MPAQEKIKVLIVDDIADTRENLKETPAVRSDN